MKGVIEVNIIGQKLLIKSDSDEEYIKIIADYLNSKIEEVKTDTKTISTVNMVLIAAMNIAHAYFEMNKKLTKIEDDSKKLSKLIDERIK